MDTHHSIASPTPMVNLLWTGGWDSTYRLLTLLLSEHVTIQPYYVIDEAKLRPSVPAERAAMQRIREAIGVTHPDAMPRLLPTIEVPVGDIATNDVIHSHFERCLRTGFIGGQYEWLARLCAERKIQQLELAIHRDDRARELLADVIGPDHRTLDPRHAADDRYELFKYFRFPVFDKTKRDMRDDARRAGFEDLMALTWFCHRPKHGQPCGVCNPCIYTIEEGLADRIPWRGRVRYQLRIIPRIRRWITNHPSLYTKVRTPYKRLRSLGRA